MKFAKYHALGNDYIVVHPDDLPDGLTPQTVRLICHVHYGIGSDGILLGPLPSDRADVGLRIFNPDGSEAEKSGNGLRIFARFLWDQGHVQDNRFTVDTLGGKVTCRVAPDGNQVRVAMGQVSFDSLKIPVQGAPREVLNEQIEMGGGLLRFSAATVGNPHCIVFCDDPTPDLARRLGPSIEVDPRFPNRTNVQFMQVIDRHRIRIEIWERGAGYTLASGSSSTAAAAVAFRQGLCEPDITVQMPGGNLKIRLSSDFRAALTGPVTKVCQGVMAQEMFSYETRMA